MTKRSMSGWEKAIIVSVAAMVVVVAGVIGFAVTRSDSNSSELYSFTIEAGTRVLLDQGQAPPNQPPTDLALQVGDTLEVINKSLSAFIWFAIVPAAVSAFTL